MKLFNTNKATDKTTDELKETIVELKREVEDLEFELDQLAEQFPLTLGQTVYDIALKDSKGRYTKTDPSADYSIINAVIVDEKNYFNLAERFKRNNDVFFSEAEAAAYLNRICK